MSKGGGAPGVHRTVPEGARCRWRDLPLALRLRRVDAASRGDGTRYDPGPPGHRRARAQTSTACCRDAAAGLERLGLWRSEPVTRPPRPDFCVASRGDLGVFTFCSDGRKHVRLITGLRCFVRKPDPPGSLSSSLHPRRAYSLFPFPFPGDFQMGADERARTQSPVPTEVAFPLGGQG